MVQQHMDDVFERSGEGEMQAGLVSVWSIEDAKLMVGDAVPCPVMDAGV